MDLTEVGRINAATEILGDKWTPELLRHFFSSDSVRFCQLQNISGGINPRTLSARLSHLETTGIITKTLSGASRCEYAITPKGRDLLPILQSMQEWSEKYEN